MPNHPSTIPMVLDLQDKKATLPGLEKKVASERNPGDNYGSSEMYRPKKRAIYEQFL